MQSSYAQAHKTSAWPLALLFAALITYASLYPFTDWRDQGVQAWAYLLAPLPKYWTGFDLIANLVGYAPLGFLLCLSALRTGRARHAVLLASVAAALLSFTLESLQSFLPSRVASNVDLGLNAVGAWLGAASALLLERLGLLARWSRFRAHWFVSDARGALVLLALWPAALLFPPALPFGLGQVAERLEAALASALQGTPFLDWLPVRSVELQPLVPLAELLCVSLSALAPCLLGYSVIRLARLRALFFIAYYALGTLASALSATLSYGPAHTWSWLSTPVPAGLAVAVLASLACLWLPRRGCAAVALLAWAVALTLLNQAPTNAYFAQTLQTWEQGRFIRFHGLAQWLGWLWPYAALVYVLYQVGGRGAARRA